jgi:5-methylcytosine-specific restriction protein B
MTTDHIPRAARPAWFVGAAYGGTDDQAPRFIAERMWKNASKHKYHDVVRSMRPGDRIAMKASYRRKHGLPFDSRGQFVSVMAIKAVGTITENVGDGQVVRVDWAPDGPPREWYFFTHRGTVWRVERATGGTMSLSRSRSTASRRTSAAFSVRATDCR